MSVLALNEHWHYRCCVSDGVFDTADDGSLRFVFATIDAQSVAQVQARVRRQVLAAYRRRGWLDAASAAADEVDLRPAWWWRCLGRP